MFVKMNVVLGLYSKPMAIEQMNLAGKLTMSFLLPKVGQMICQTYNHYIGIIMLPKVMASWFEKSLLMVFITRLSLIGMSCLNNKTN